MPLSFVTKLKNASQAYTFRDFILLPGRSDVEPRDIDLSSRLTKKIKLSLPFISSPMDTVTEWRMAAELARIGAVGVIHRNMSIERQTEEVDRVKRSESGMIVDPVTISPENSVHHALDLMNKYHVSGLPVTHGS